MCVCVDVVGCQNRSESNQLKFSFKWNQFGTFGSVFFKVMFRCYLNNHIDSPTIFIPLSTGSIWTSEGCNENGSFRLASGNMGVFLDWLKRDCRGLDAKAPRLDPAAGASSGNRGI